VGAIISVTRAPEVRNAMVVRTYNASGVATPEPCYLTVTC
jgi:hypothetical protein